jgi:hypothetical protein
MNTKLGNSNYFRIQPQIKQQFCLRGNQRDDSFWWITDVYRMVKLICKTALHSTKISYSYFNASTGFDFAARYACQLTVKSAIITVDTPVIRNTCQPMEIW